MYLHPVPTDLMCTGREPVSEEVQEMYRRPTYLRNRDLDWQYGLDEYLVLGYSPMINFPMLVNNDFPPGTIGTHWHVLGRWDVLGLLNDEVQVLFESRPF